MRKPDQHDEIAPGSIIDGRYRVVRAIGQGGNGLVYEVEHTRTGRRLALKMLLDQAGFARLEQEARAASLMKNGHTARIIDMEPSGQAGPYLVMELLEGQSLRALLDEAGQLPLELTVNLAMQVCECLYESHGLGIIHRDLKPENVFLCASPWPGQYDVKVLDFGVMKIAADGGVIPKSSLTRTGSTVGTPYYMSLEQLRNSSAVDARADVYSLGVVLYECLSGRKPFQAETLGELVYALCSGPPTPLARIRPDLPAEVGDAIMRTLSANRDDRPPSMLDLARALIPFANPAFALWIKVDGRSLALAPRASMPSMPVVQEAPPAWPPPPPLPVEASGRRDTPTEMYVKSVHGPLEPAEVEVVPEPVNGQAARDHDTPTRAYQVDSTRGTRPPMLETLQSAVDPGVSDLADGGITIKQAPKPVVTFGTPPPAPLLADKPVMAAPPGSMMTMPLGAIKQTVPLGNILRALPAPPAQAQAPTRPPKPAWQRSLDGALIAVGRASEHAVRRLRRSPALMAVIGVGALLVLGLLVFLLVG